MGVPAADPAPNPRRVARNLGFDVLPPHSEGASQELPWSWRAGLTDVDVVSPYAPVQSVRAGGGRVDSWRQAEGSEPTATTSPARPTQPSQWMDGIRDAATRWLPGRNA